MKRDVRSKFNVVLLFKRKAQPDSHVVDVLERELTAAGYRVFVDRLLPVGAEWANLIESRIRTADAVIPILSESAMSGEMLQFQVETAIDERRNRGRPFILPIKVSTSRQPTGPVGALVSGLPFVEWQTPMHDVRLVEEVIRALDLSSSELGPDHHLGPAGGAVLPDSAYYILRDADRELKNAIRARESVILLRGPRQIGKTSLLGQGARLVSDLGWNQATTDFQMISSSQLTNADFFARMLAATISRQLGFKYNFESEWQDVFGPNLNMSNFMRSLIASFDAPVVWFMDEADRLFHARFGSDFFGLVRSWHNARATDPSGPWSRFTVVIAYATEARLFIRDLNQSPFNVGRHIGMANFTIEQTDELNKRYGGPVKRHSDLEALHFLLAGQPFLVRRAFDELSTGEMEFATLIETADRNDGPFGDHLQRMLVAVSQFPDVLTALRSSLDASAHTDDASVAKLVAAGVLRQEPGGRAVPACDLYAQYLINNIG